MRMSPEVSVIVPTRNALTWLPTALESIGANPRAEIIVVDDGSTDETLSYLQRRAEGDARLRILNGPAAGPSRARNVALDAARAPLIAFLDADDRWYPGKLDAQLALHRESPELGFSFTDYRHVTVAGEDRGNAFGFWPRFSARLRGRIAPFLIDAPVATIFAENVVGCSTVMVRTDLLRRVGGFSTQLTSAEDWDLWMTLAARAPVGVMPGVWCDYLMHRPGNVTGRMDVRVAAMRIIADKHRAVAMREDRSAAPALAARLAAAEAELREARGQRLLATQWRVRAFLHQPSPRAAREAIAALRPRHAA